MNKLVYAALALGGISLASGCVINTGSRADIDVQWLVSGEISDGDGCAELNADAVEVVTERVSTGEREIEIFNCSTERVLLSRRLGTYDVWVNAIDEDERLLGQSPIEVADLEFSGDVIEIPELAFQNAQFEATWQLTDEGTNQAITCSEAGVGGISVLATLAGRAGTAFDDIRDCPANADQGDIVTESLPLGDYTIDVSVLDSQTDEALSDPVIKEGELVNHATIVDLGVFEFIFR